MPMIKERKLHNVKKCAPPSEYEYGGRTYIKYGNGFGQAASDKQKKAGRTYTWNEKNELSASSDSRYNVNYIYGEEGERTAKVAHSSTGTTSETLYFNKMYSWHYDGAISDYTGNYSKNIFLGETRILTKVNRADTFTSEEYAKQYWYHSDHLGSASLITDYQGKEYERIEYTPYGELWVERKTPTDNLDTIFRFSGKELDVETGNYYYGARYLDPRTSRWLSTDPALGEYIPGAPINDEAKKRNGNLPGMGGVFNVINFHLFAYAANNPVKYTDPDGRASVSEIYKQWSKLNTHEKKVILGSWLGIFKAFRVNDNAALAQKFTRANFNGKNGWGDRSDAFRHTLWMAMNTQKTGEKFSQKYGDAHEYSTAKDDSADVYMDIHNNSIGIELGKSNPKASPQELSSMILDKIKNGDMLILDRETNQLYRSNDLSHENPISLDSDFIRRSDVSRKITEE